MLRNILDLPYLIIFASYLVVGVALVLVILVLVLVLVILDRKVEKLRKRSLLLMLE